MRKFRILALDGGGIRGLYSACFLKNFVGHFNEHFNATSKETPDIGRAFDLICGTSTGAILTCALAAGIPINQIINLYIKQGKNIFPYAMPNRTNLTGKIHFGVWCALHCFMNPANKRVLKTQLLECFGSKDIAWLHKERNGINICIPSINALNYHPVVFKTPHHATKYLDNNTSLVDICLASSAAPIFFPLHMIEKNERAGLYIDGGLWANNPSLIGLIEALSLTDKDDEIQLISLGTSDVPVGHNGEKKLRKGLWGWKGGIEVGLASMTAQAIGANYLVVLLCQQLREMGRNITYYRFTEESRGIDDYLSLALDKASKASIDHLQDLARNDARHNHHKILDSITKNCQDGLVVQEIFSSIKSFKEDNNNGKLS